MADTTRLNQLVQTILKNPNPAARLEALLEIRRYDNPRVTDLLRHISQEDRDAKVRDLAGNLYVKKKVAAMQSAGESVMLDFTADLPAPETPQTRAPARSDTWTCSACGGENSGGSACRFCGWERAAATPADRPQPAETFHPGDDIFVLDIQHAAFVAGRVQRPSASSGLTCTALFMIPFLVIGLIMIVSTLRDVSIALAINNHGVAVQGKIVNKHISSDDSSDTYYVSFEYTYNGIPYAAEQTVNQDVFNRAEYGATVNLLLLPEDPGIARMAGHAETHFSMILATVCWNGIVWTTVIGMFSASRRYRHLMREGQKIRGEIVSIKGHTNSDDDYIITVEYAFRAPDDGTLIIGKQRHTRNDLKRERLPRQGAPVAVIYRNKNHYRML